MDIDKILKLASKFEKQAQETPADAYTVFYEGSKRRHIKEEAEMLADMLNKATGPPNLFYVDLI